jgi:hypothetical protein
MVTWAPRLSQLIDCRVALATLAASEQDALELVLQQKVRHLVRGVRSALTG